MISGVVPILPSIWPEWTDACLHSMTPELQNRTVVIDNTTRNLGVAASWNVGAKLVLKQQLDWLVIISAAVRFGRPGGQDFLDALEGKEQDWAVEAGDDLGWHLIAFPRRTLERVGLFDENFWPAYWEDVDFGYRILLETGMEYPPQARAWDKVLVDAWMVGTAHGIHLAKVESNPDALIAYITAKWGAANAHEFRFRHPFNDPFLPASWWPEPGDHRAVVHPGRPA